MNSNADPRDRIGSMSPEALERLIYVVGSARGGTTLTNKVIGVHDNVIALGPTHFLNHPWRHRNRLETRLWNVVFWMPGSVRRSHARDALDPERRVAFVRHTARALKRRDLKELYQIYPLVRAIDPDEPRRPDDILAWVDKGNDFWGVDLLPRHFPEARFVFVVRDPRGSVSSLSKRIADGRSDADFRVELRDVITSAIYWRNLVQKGLHFAHHYPGRTAFFRYEDMVTRPLEIVPLLYDFLCLPPMPDERLRRKLESVTYITSLDGNERGVGLSTKPIERWREKLAAEAVDCVAEICGPTARRFGYDLNEPRQPRGILGLAGQMSSRSAQAAVAAKLVYMALREAQLGAASSFATAPMRLIAGS